MCHVNIFWVKKINISSDQIWFILGSSQHPIYPGIFLNKLSLQMF